MATADSKYRNLHNNLNDFELSEEEFEDLRSNYEFEKSKKRGPGKLGRFAKFTGIVFLVIASLFVIQQFIFPYGPDLASILRFIPASGTLLVILVASGLFLQYRVRRNRKKHNRYSDNQKSATDNDASNPGKTDTGYATAGSRYHESDDFDTYAYINRKKWYRSQREKMLFGVCGGIGERLDIDPTFVRALFALAFFSYGFSFVFYIVLAIVLPKEPLHRPT